MTAPAWPGLGFDPAPGDPAGAAALAQQLTGTARHLHETHAVLAAVRDQRGTWTGEASRAFADRIDVLPRYLDDAQTSLQRAGGVLDGWAARLGGLQTRARDLEGRAVTTRSRLVSAEDAERRARAHPDLGLIGRLFPEPELPAVERRIALAQTALEDAVRAVTRLRDSLTDLLREGEALRAEHEGEARRTADGVRAADDKLAPPEPSWFDQATDWVGDHLSEIGDVAGIVAAVAGTLALFPALAPIAAPIALVAGGVALLAHGADMVADDKWSDGGAWVDLVADGVGLIPGVRALGAAADGADFAFRTTEGIRHTIAGAAEMYGRQFGEAGPLYRAAADRLAPVLDGTLPHLTGVPGAATDPAAVARTLESTVNLGTQVPTMADLTSSEDYGAEKVAAGTLSSGMGIADEQGLGWVDAIRRAAR